ncbi:LysE family translocator [Nocardioides acrostichi]|uniref:LysE family translocator n=1 Tax=Nocardioides acrostichi TaxID=2784339 RepID=A0A930Y5X1_9ACTN|nr:LysE family translocator [Nocardioides acrostichi]MBF4160326.1 LysE family translocator [Nocardioides acrostichi]
METYLSFVAFCTLLAVAPGPDTFLVLRASVVGGHRRGLATTFGVSVAGAVQGTLAATGLGALLASSEHVFAVVRWIGVAYLAWLGVSALLGAWRGGEGWTLGTPGARVGAVRAFRQGFVCNITNPKVLAFNLAVLPQFVGSDAGVPTLLAYALTLTAIGAVVQLAIVWLARRAAAVFDRSGFRRGVDGVTGVVMLGFAGALALDVS